MGTVEAVHIVVFGGTKPDNINDARWSAMMCHIAREFLKETRGDRKL